MTQKRVGEFAELRRKFALVGFSISIMLMSLVRNAAKWVSLLGIGVVGFAIMALAIHSALGNPLRLYSEARSEKLYILDHSDQSYTAAAFGSSRIHDAFDPGAFDGAMAAAGHPAKSLNLAVYGGSQTEQRAMAREFVQHESSGRAGPAGTAGNKCTGCLIILEFNAGANLQPENLINPRAIDLYDLDTARFAAAYTGHEASIFQRVGRTAYAVVGSVLHEVNVGMLSSFIFQPPLNEKLLTDFTRDDHRGRLINPPSKKGELDVQAEFHKHPKPPSTANHDAVPPGAYELLRDLARSNSTGKLQFIYILSPKLSSLEQMGELPCTIEGLYGPVPIFNFDRPDRYPELFTPEMWHDFAHLSDRGGTYFSKLVAREVSAWLDGTPPTGCGG